MERGLCFPPLSLRDQQLGRGVVLGGLPRPKRVSRKDGGGEKEGGREGGRERNGGQWLGITSCPRQPAPGIASSFPPPTCRCLKPPPHPHKKEPYT